MQLDTTNRGFHPDDIERLCEERRNGTGGGRQEVTHGVSLQTALNLDPFMIHETFLCLTETAFGSHPCRVVSVTYRKLRPFHGGNTGSNPVGDAKSYQRFTRKPHQHRDTQKIHALSAGSSLQLCFARPACRARELGCRCPASSLTLSVATTPAPLSHPHHCP